MGDEEKGKHEEEKKDDDDEQKEPGWCFYFGQCIHISVKTIYACIVKFIMAICNGLGYCWYPTKERLYDSCECCGKRINQHLDASY